MFLLLIAPYVNSTNRTCLCGVGSFFASLGPPTRGILREQAWLHEVFEGSVLGDWKFNIIASRWFHSGWLYNLIHQYWLQSAPRSSTATIWAMSDLQCEHRYIQHPWMNWILLRLSSTLVFHPLYYPSGTIEDWTANADFTAAACWLAGDSNHQDRGGRLSSNGHGPARVHWKAALPSHSVPRKVVHHPPASRSFLSLVVCRRYIAALPSMENNDGFFTNW